MNPTRDNIFYYDLDRTLDDALNAHQPTTPDETIPETTTSE
jgi:hypothetical protein